MQKNFNNRNHTDFISSDCRILEMVLKDRIKICCFFFQLAYTVKILKLRTPQTIAIIVLKIEKFDVTLH